MPCQPGERLFPPHKLAHRRRWLSALAAGITVIEIGSTTVRGQAGSLVLSRRPASRKVLFRERGRRPTRRPALTGWRVGRSGRARGHEAAVGSGVAVGVSVGVGVGVSVSCSSSVLGCTTMPWAVSGPPVTSRREMMMTHEPTASWSPIPPEGSWPPRRRRRCIHCRPPPGG